jgi:ATP-dependent RNA helicase DDX49/DBP8
MKSAYGCTKAGNTEEREQDEPHPMSILQVADSGKVCELWHRAPAPLFPLFPQPLALSDSGNLVLMAGSKSKRREITTDDLMRLQEGPPRKRVKLLEELSDDHSDASGSVSDAAASEGALSYHDGEGPMEDGVEDEEAEDGVSSDDEDGAVAAAAPAPSVSRVTAIPRVQQPARAVSTQKISGATSWLDLSVSSALHAALLSMSIRTPTEIQSACIPPLLAGEPSISYTWLVLMLVQGRDCIGIAKTGSGKTIAFALPILQRLAVDPYGIFALVLTPTR